MFGALVAIFPFAAGWGVVAGPMQNGKNGPSGDGETGFLPVCPLDSIPDDGKPHAFVVISDTVDAWTRTPNQRIGEVFLTRGDADGKPHVTAFTTTCPHLGCAVEFDADEDRFECPCHESFFSVDGNKIPGSPSPRGLDPLDVKLKDNGDGQEVWVRYQRFRAGIAERDPIA